MKTKRQRLGIVAASRTGKCAATQVSTYVNPSKYSCPPNVAIVNCMLVYRTDCEGFFTIYEVGVKSGCWVCSNSSKRTELNVAFATLLFN